LNALYNMGIILWKLKRPQEAMDKFTALLAKAPEDTDALYAAGSLLLSLDDAESSVEMLSRYLEKKPGDTDGWYLLGAGAERQKKYSRALEAYDKIIAIDPAQADAWFAEARLLLTVVEDPQRGLEALGRSLGAGFKDIKALKALLDSTALLERDRVEATLQDHGLMPDRTSAQTQLAPADKKATVAPDARSVTGMQPTSGP
jgi:tetratricopeptide (TPR) repeat protein